MSPHLAQPSRFTYKNGILHCEDVPLSAVAAAAGTPVFVYSSAELLHRAGTYLDQARRMGATALVCYAVKANGNPTLLKRLAAAGLGADVTSGGELFLAQQAGFPADRIIFSGVGKKAEEIGQAIDAGIRALHVESEMELEAISRLARERRQTARIGVRVNPNISTETHAYISTGLHGHKFGVPRERAQTILREATADPWLQPVGLAAHIGSQITELEPYAKSVAFLTDFAEELRDEGIRLRYIDVGGGLGIDYAAPAPKIAAWVETVAGQVVARGYDLVMEPGRSIVGPAGILLTEIIYTKQQGDKRFVIVDAGMTDLIRPTLYDAYHPILPEKEQSGAPPEKVDVVGPICETGDWLARERLLPPLVAGDRLSVLHAGAYGFAMSSNYNGHLKAAEVLVEGDEIRLIRRRQRYEHLLDGSADELLKPH